MEKKFSTQWIKSKQVRKQRKYRFNAPLHIKQKFVSVHLSPELRKKYNTRSVVVKKGDTVKVLRGQYKGKQNKIERVDLKKGVVYIGGIEISKREGSKAIPPLQPSNIMITEINADDKKRQKTLKTTQTQK